MLPYDSPLTPEIERRYQRLAGPFAPCQPALIDGMCAFLAQTGARAMRVGERDGVCVWRLRSECETIEQTERRLRKLSQKRTTNR